MNEITTSYHSYPKIYALGHRYLKQLFDDPVLVEEKVDGSQFSFGRFGAELRCRSKGCQLNMECPEKLFLKAVEVVKTLDLRDGWTYRAEYLASPHHNTLSYERTPKNHLIIFDINTAEESYLSPAEKLIEAERIGLECVPLLYQGQIDSAEFVLQFLQKTSILGGQKIEGVVIKNYSKFGDDKKALMGKYVSEQFKEIHGGEWREKNPTSGDVIQKIIMSLKTPARWAKAVQHLKEAGKLENSPRDIGSLIKEVQRDVSEECEQEIKDALHKFAMSHIMRGVTGGLPEWYKEQLLKSQFEKN